MFNFSDTINLFSKLTLRRLCNGALIFLGFYISKIIKRPMMMGSAVAISIEPTTSCNLRCPQCPSGLRSFSRPTGMLKQETFKKVLDQITSHLLYITFYFQGEPYLHPSFLDMVKYAASRRIYTATSTNGHFLSDAAAKSTVTSGLDKLVISIDGTTQDVYENYRIGGSLEKVKTGIKNIVLWKQKLKSKTPFIVLQFLILKKNEHQIQDMKKLAAELGVNKLSFKTAQVYDYENGHGFIPSNESFSRYRKENGAYATKNKFLNHCWRMWHSCVITWDGKVVPCCFDKDASHELGNLQKNSFLEIWQGEAYHQFRYALLKGRENIDICKNCSEGVKVFARP